MATAFHKRAAAPARTAGHSPEWPVISIPPAAARTLQGFRAWAHSDKFPERGRVSFINGEILIDMSPEDLSTHSRIKAEIGCRIHQLVEQFDLGEFYPDRTLLTNAAAQLSTEPDGTFVRWDSFESGRVRRVPAKGRKGQYVELEGAVDWVLEIVSPSSIDKDTRALRDSYYLAGISEYWLVDALGAQVKLQILQRRRTGYAAVANRKGWHRSRVFDRQFRLSRCESRPGFWRYSLESKPV
jgi:Uma2 family endonuclease